MIESAADAAAATIATGTAVAVGAALTALDLLDFTSPASP